MVKRIEVSTKILDTKAERQNKKFLDMGFSVQNLQMVNVYTIDSDFDKIKNRKQIKIEDIATLLYNPVAEEASIDSLFNKKFDWAIEVGFLPGVTDNVGNTAKESIDDFLEEKLDGEVYSSQLMFLSGKISKEEIEKIAESVYNPLIQRIQIKSKEEFDKDQGMNLIVPKVELNEVSSVLEVEIFSMNDEELIELGKKGIVDENGFKRGPLSLSLNYLKAIKEYFISKNRNPTDIELESLAQTWSEHCKHTIFADPIDEIVDGLYKTFIKGATKKIRADWKKERKGDFCVSVFTDNAGGIIFDDDNFICDKVETHNSPSALDPFGGSITGIVGVNRDVLGFGLGAKPIMNRYGFCFGLPEDVNTLYRDAKLKEKLLSPLRILEGVVDGVNVGGNCSGIPTTQGFVYFNDNYKGKPLVFVGTIGLIPRKHNEKSMVKKSALPGDYIVMVGGKVGKDGIHGATFSSETLDSTSPATAVQIGDPITQKKMSDVLINEARNKKLYNSITDNGAGGLSCSVAEMAKESGGCKVNLDKVPLKYKGLQPWEIWISESQERMTLSISPDKWEEFSKLMKSRGVEATVIGEFTDSGNCVVDYEGKQIMNLGMNFLHNGLPSRQMTTNYINKKREEPKFDCPDNLSESLLLMLNRHNIAGKEFISQQYDHEVQGGSVLKPLQGKGKINGDTTISRPKLDSDKGVVLSQGVYPSYSEIDTYHMAASAIDTAIRNAICAGGSLDHLALLDNFCWCSSDTPERLGQLKEAVKACYDYAIAYGTPFISGKDSMFNDFKGFNENGEEVKISVPPTLLISSVGVVNDTWKTVSLDAKFVGDLVYVLGETKEELGGSEYFAMTGEIERGEKYVGNSVPKVNADVNKKLYQSLERCINLELIASAQSVGLGGLGVALAKTSMGGKLGLDVDIAIFSEELRDDYKLYSESQGRVVVTVNPEFKEDFEKVMVGNLVSCIGVIKDDDKFIVRKNDMEVINVNVSEMLNSYKMRFGNF